MAVEKLSQINNGGAINTATDQCVAVRSGTTDELVSLGTAASVNTGTSGATIPLLNGNNTYSGTSTFSNQALLTGTITPSAIGSGNVNNWNPTGLSGANVIRATGNGTTTITGLAGGVDGRIIILENIGFNVGSNIYLSNQDTNSTAANRFVLQGGINDIGTAFLPEGSNVILRYDGTLSRWLPISYGVIHQPGGAHYQLQYYGLDGEFAGDPSMTTDGAGDLTLNTIYVNTGINFPNNGDITWNGLSGAPNIYNYYSGGILHYENSGGGDFVLKNNSGVWNVGINTYSPAYPLDVAGDVNISSGSQYLIDGSPIVFSVAGNAGDIQLNGGNNTLSTPANDALYGLSGSVGTLFGVNTSAAPVASGDFRAVTITATDPTITSIAFDFTGAAYSPDGDGAAITRNLYEFNTLAGTDVYDATPPSITLTEYFNPVGASNVENDNTGSYIAGGQSFTYYIYAVYNSKIASGITTVFTDSYNDGSNFSVTINWSQNPQDNGGPTPDSICVYNSTEGTYTNVSSGTYTVTDNGDGSWTSGSPPVTGLSFNIAIGVTQGAIGENYFLTGYNPNGYTPADGIVVDATGSSQTISDGAGWSASPTLTPVSPYTFPSINANGNVLLAAASDIVWTTANGVMTISPDSNGGITWSSSSSVASYFTVESTGGGGILFGSYNNGAQILQTSSGTLQIQAYGGSLANINALNYNANSVSGASGTDPVGNVFSGGIVTTVGSGGGSYSPMPTTVVTGTTQAMSTNHAYASNNAGLVTMTLPSTFAVGDEMIVMGLGAGGWEIAQNASQIIHFGSVATTSGTGGNIASANRYDTIHLKALVANTTLTVIGAQGTPLVT